MNSKGYEKVSFSCEHSNEISDSIKCKEYLD